MRLLNILSCAAALAIIPASVQAGMFTPGNVVVYRVGTGSGSLVNTGNPVFVDEYKTNVPNQAAPVQSITMPSAGGGTKLVASGTATSEGLLTVSPNGQYVSLTGYNASIPTTGLAGTSSATVNRSVAVIPVSTGIAGFTSLSDFASGNNPRSAVTTDGTSIWVTGGAGGVRYTTAGSSTSTQIVPNSPATLQNFRQVNVFDGQLYASTSATTGSNTSPLFAIGAGTPTTSPQNYNGLPGLPNVSSVIDDAFFFADLDTSVPGLDTLYVADEGTGLTKFSLVSGNWTNNGTVGLASDNYRGVTGFVSGTTVNLFATRKGGSGATGGGELLSLVDATGYNGAFVGAPTLLATAASNEAFRGVAYIPVVPEPSSCLLALMGIAGAAVVARRRSVGFSPLAI
jgi:hypothetical protein